MPGGRPPLGPAVVDGLEGPDEPKRRLKSILEVMAQLKTVAAACEELGVERARFYVLQRQALLGALEGLTPKQSGRPARPEPTAEELEISALKEQLAELQLDAQAAEIREEIATTMPHLAARKSGQGEKKRKRPW